MYKSTKLYHSRIWLLQWIEHLHRRLRQQLETNGWHYKRIHSVKAKLHFSRRKNSLLSKTWLLYKTHTWNLILLWLKLLFCAWLAQALPKWYPCREISMMCSFHWSFPANFVNPFDVLNLASIKKIIYIVASDYIKHQNSMKGNGKKIAKFVKVFFFFMYYVL